MSNLIPLFIKRVNTDYRKIVDTLEKVEMEILKLETTIAKLKEKEYELKRMRDKIEQQVTEGLLNTPKLPGD